MVEFGDWGLGIGDWGLGPIPTPQSPIPHPQSPLYLSLLKFKFINPLLIPEYLNYLIFKNINLISFNFIPFKKCKSHLT